MGEVEKGRSPAISGRIDIDDRQDSYSVVSFSNGPTNDFLAINLGLPIDNTDPSAAGTRPGESFLEGFNAAAIPPYLGTGLPAGQSYLLGTITFHKDGPGVVLPIEAVLLINDGISLGTGAGTLPLSQVSLGSATLNNVPEPGTVSLLALGLTGLALTSRRKK